MASGIRGILASLSIKLSADSAELDRDLDKAKKSARDWGNETKTAAMNVGAAMGTAAVALGAAMTAIATKAIESMDRQADFAESISVSVEQLTRLQYAAKMSGVEQEALNNGLKTLAKNSSEAAQGLGKSVGAFNELGLSAAKMNDLAPDQQLLVMADAMKTVENANDRTRIAMKLFGDEGAAMVNVLMQGQDGLRALAEESDRAGFTITKDQAALAGAADKAMNGMSLAFDGIANQLAVQMAPAITNVAETIAKYLPDAIDFAKSAFYGLRLATYNVIDVIKAQFSTVAGVVMSAIVDPIRYAVDAAAYTLESLGVESAEAVRNVALQLGAASDTAHEMALAYTTLGDRIAENSKQYDDAIDAMVQEKIARQEQLQASKAAAIALEEVTGLTKTKAESDRAAAAAAKAHAEAEAEKAKTLKLTLDESAKALAAEGEAELARQQAAKDASLQNAQGMISGIGGLDAVGSDPMAQAQSEWVGKQAALEWMLQQEQITRDEYFQLNQEATRAHQQTLTEIEAEAAARRAQYDNMTAMQKTKFGLEQMQMLTNGIANHSRKAFEANKAASIGLAIINTAEGATKALAQGGFYGFAMAAAVIAAGVAQINAIRSQKFGGGTTPSLAGSTPTYNGVPVTGGNSQNTGDENGASTEKSVVVNVTIGKVDASQGVTAENLTSSIGAVLKDQVVTVMQDHINNDGIIIPPGSRQAAELRGAA